MREEAIPAELAEISATKRHEMIATLAEVDDEIAEIFLNEKTPTEEQIFAAVRRQCIARKFTPVSFFLILVQEQNVL